MAGKSYIKVGSTNWDRIKKMYIKTGGQTWTAIRKAYVKTNTGWKKVFDTASNRPFISGNDVPKIRLNTFRTDSTYNPTGTIDDPVNPVVEAPPVQQMGPSYTSPVLGWPYESLGRHLWGYDGTWVSGNGTSMTFTYTWLYNYSGNANDNTPEYNATSSTGRTDMLTNTSTYLGQNDGDYFDRNFLTFRVTATNSAGSASAESAQVYIVRERPTGTMTMVSPSEASPNTTMSATFTYSNSWYNKTDVSESYVEWFAVDNLGDALTTSNRVQLETLNTFSPTGTSTKTATTYHVATIANKYYYARITLNNSNTLPAKYNGSVINVSGFTPNSAFTATANKTAKTASANGPFNLTNVTKTSRFYDSGSATFQRYVSVDIGQSSGATQYEVQIEGQYPGPQGAYDTSISASSWIVLQTLDAAPYVYESSRSGGSLIYTKAVTNYKNYRVTARSRNGTSLNGAAYSNNGTSSSYVFITAPDVAPSAPSISSISTSSGYGGASISFNVTQSSEGSNGWSYYQYSLNGGSWTIPSGNSYINTTSGQIAVDSGTFYTVKIRLTNLDDATSSESNTLSITSASPPTAPTSVVIKSFSAYTGNIFFTSGSNTGSVKGYLDYEQFVGGGGSVFDSINNYVNIGSNTAGVIYLTGANSQTRVYTAYTLPFSGSNLGGFQGPLTTHTTKVLNGSDAMSISNFSLSSGSQSSLTIAWSGSGAVNKYRARLYLNSNNSLVEDKGYTLTSGSATFTGLSSGTTYYVVVNPRYEYTTSVYEDGTQGTSQAFATTSPNLTPPSIYYVASGSAGGPVTAYFTGGSGPYYQIWWTTGVGGNSYDEYGSSSPITDNTGPTDHTVTYYMYVRSVSSLANVGLGPSATISEWSSGYAFTVTAPQYTISWNANGGSVSPTSNTVVSGTSVSAPTPTRSGYTFLYWRDSPNAFSYIYQINPGGSWTVTSNITFYAYWQSSVTAPATPTGVTVSGSGLVSWTAVSGADTYEVLNYTDRTGSPTNTTNRLGPYTTTGITGTSFQLTSSQGYSSPNNWARAQVRARNSAGVSTYSAWYPSSTTYV